MEDLIRLMVQAIVDYPEGIEVNEIQGRQSTIIELMVSKPDVGKVIGRDGKTAAALRTIINAAAGKNRKHVVLGIIE